MLSVSISFLSENGAERHRSGYSAKESETIKMAGYKKHSWGMSKAFEAVSVKHTAEHLREVTGHDYMCISVQEDFAKEIDERIKQQGADQTFFDENGKEISWSSYAAWKREISGCDICGIAVEPSVEIEEMGILRNGKDELIDVYDMQPQTHVIEVKGVRKDVYLPRNNDIEIGGLESGSVFFEVFSSSNTPTDKWGWLHAYCHPAEKIIDDKKRGGAIPTHLVFVMYGVEAPLFTVCFEWQSLVALLNEKYFHGMLFPEWNVPDKNSKYWKSEPHLVERYSAEDRKTVQVNTFHVPLSELMELHPRIITTDALTIGEAERIYEACGKKHYHRVDVMQRRIEWILEHRTGTIDTEREAERKRIDQELKRRRSIE